MFLVLGMWQLRTPRYQKKTAGPRLPRILPELPLHLRCDLYISISLRVPLTVRRLGNATDRTNEYRHVD